jgi:monooxygenase
MSEHLDVLIIGAGISGIGAAYHLQTRCPNKTYAVLEGRPQLGGTWDLFRYPGIRSDSDMHTMGFSFKPWTGEKALADGASILAYLQETVAENRIDERIRYGHEVVAANWSSEDKLWSVEVSALGESKHFTCNFIFSCTGYYDYEKGYTPKFEGSDDFEGEILHPQKWPKDFDYAGKRVVVIGSGATAVTLVPAMADKAAHVTMLQRTPTYVVSVPGEDGVATALKKRLPPKTAYRLTRWKNIALGLGFFTFARKAPGPMRALVNKGVRAQLGEDYDVSPHFDPPYNPWEQRMCMVPDGDFFRAIKKEKASITTGHIDRFTKNGIRLKNGEEIEADIIVTATGLVLEFMSKIDVRVDGKRVDPSDHWTYKAMMFNDVPNLALWFGYTNASWTLKADLTSEYICRLINHMDATGYGSVVPRANPAEMKSRPFIDFSSGYFQRSQHLLPKQGDAFPWRLFQNYVLDSLSIRYSKLKDGVLEFR